MEQPQQTSQTYKWIEATIPISLSPVYQKSIRKGIEKFLERLLNQYVKEFNGVLLAFKNLKLISTLSEIKNESPFIQVQVLFGAWVFCPFVDAVIDGVVTKVSPGHIGLLIDGLFNASIAASSQLIPFGWVYNGQDHFWDGNTGSEQLGEIGEGTVVRFRINRVDKSKNMINISGSLNPKNGELLGALETCTLPPTIIVDPSLLEAKDTTDHIDLEKGIVDPFADEDDNDIKKQQESNGNLIVLQHDHEDSVESKNTKQELRKPVSEKEKSISNKISFSSSPMKAPELEIDTSIPTETVLVKATKKKSKKQKDPANSTTTESTQSKKRKGAELLEEEKESSVLQQHDITTTKEQDKVLVSESPKRSSAKKEKKAKKSKMEK